MSEDKIEYFIPLTPTERRAIYKGNIHLTNQRVPPQVEEWEQGYADERGAEVGDLEDGWTENWS